MWLFLAKIAPTFFGLFSKIICNNWDARPSLRGLDLNNFTNTSCWLWGLIDLMLERVLQSHKRASDRPPDDISDKIIVSNFVKREILCFTDASSSTSFHAGSDKYNWTILCLKCQHILLRQQVEDAHFPNKTHIYLFCLSNLVCIIKYLIRQAI